MTRNEPNLPPGSGSTSGIAALLHSGRVIRIDTPDDSAWLHGVVAAGQSAAMICYVQLDEPRNDQPVAMRVPGLNHGRRYRITDVTPGAPPRRPGFRAPAVAGLGIEVAGAALGELGLAIPVQRPLTAIVIQVEAI